MVKYELYKNPDTNNTANTQKSGNSQNTQKTNFPPPNWDKIVTKRTPKMSDEEFEQAIRAQAKKDAANGIYANNKEHSSLYFDYLSAVAPDRKAMFNANPKSGKLTDLINGNAALTYNTASKMWMTVMTDTEKARAKMFNDIYREAFAVYEAEHGAVKIKPKVESFIMYG